MNRACLGVDRPNDFDSVFEVPLRLDEHRIDRLILTADLDREHGSGSSKFVSCRLASTPNSSVCRADLTAKEHARLVATYDELRMGAAPNVELGRDIDCDPLLVLATRRHVVEP